MKFSFVHYYNVDLNTLEILMEDKEFQAYLNNLPDISSMETLEVEESENFRIKRMKFTASGEFVKKLSKFVKDKKYFTWIEESTFDKQKHTYFFKISAPQFDKVLKCSGCRELIPEGDAKTKRIVKGEVNVNIPIIGVLIEKVLCDLFKKNYDSGHKAMERYIKMKYG